MKTVIFVYLIFFILGMSLLTLVIVSSYVSNKYPNSKVDKFLKRHIVDNYEGDNF